MRTTWLVTVALLLSALVAPTTAAVSVICNGAWCGGTGAHYFQYEVAVTEGTFTEFEVGAYLLRLVRLHGPSIKRDMRA